MNSIQFTFDQLPKYLKKLFHQWGETIYLSYGTNLNWYRANVGKKAERNRVILFLFFGLFFSAGILFSTYYNGILIQDGKLNFEVIIPVICVFAFISVFIFQPTNKSFSTLIINGKNHYWPKQGIYSLQQKVNRSWLGFLPVGAFLYFLVRYLIIPIGNGSISLESLLSWYKQEMIFGTLILFFVVLITYAIIYNIIQSIRKRTFIGDIKLHLDKKYYLLGDQLNVQIKGKHIPADIKALLVNVKQVQLERSDKDKKEKEQIIYLDHPKDRINNSFSFTIPKQKIIGTNFNDFPYSYWILIFSSEKKKLFRNYQFLLPVFADE